MGRPSRNRITRDGATVAALEIIDRDGLDALSLELVAGALGVKAPSLYYHFRDKAELLAEVARHVLLDLGPAVGGEAVAQDWNEAMVGVCLATRRTLLKHPNAAPLLLQFFPRHITLRGYDHWIANCPYPPDVRMTLLEGTEKLTYASALFEAAAQVRGVPAMPSVDPERLPHLALAQAANPYDAEGLFEQTIRTFLAGFRVRPGDA
ncbi:MULTISPECIES: TetR/AcrR family transcriptional regulator [unclassified Phenylobacterium]|uniref:TetR/AcrR family transcriptional regulator n=1 Tax=unclassified Phenylobacterium TaxID=2640670 RepID=UPI00083A5D25|nr:MULTISPECIES: helix-turn-helix domain-containing protein [unclassified Phenylobacterium]